MPRYIDEPLLPKGPYAYLLSIQVHENDICYVQENFILHPGDMFYADKQIGTTPIHQLSIYLARPMLSEQQMNWLIENGMKIQNHWMVLKNLTEQHPTIKKGIKL